MTAPPVDSGLKMRVLSALVLIPIAVAAVWLGGVTFHALLAVGGLLILIEWMTLARVPQPLVIGVGALWVVLFAVLPAVVGDFDPAIGLIVVLATAGLLVAVGLVLSHAAVRWIGYGVAYVGLPVLALVWLRGLDDGLALVAWVFLLVWATDIGGYFAGRAIGGPKLAPRLSPNKTWAGLVGGMALAAVAGAAVAAVTDLADVAVLAAASAVLAVWEQVGDILESAVKRHFGAKDSGRLIPGHGGIMDRVDGLIFVAPAVALGLVALGHAGE